MCIWENSFVETFRLTFDATCLEILDWLFVNWPFVDGFRCISGFELIIYLANL